MNKVITYGKESRNKIQEGINIVADAVSPTLGPIGKTVLIDNGQYDPIIADDGVTVANSLEFKDRYHQLGSRLIRKVAREMHNKSGDGRTTSIVLARALIQEAMKEINEDGSNIRIINERLKSGLDEAIEMLSKGKREITDVVDVANIASLDTEVADVIARAFNEVGIGGLVTVEASNTLGINLETVKGMKIGTGLITPYLINEPDKNRCVLKDAHVLISEQPIGTNKQIRKIVSEIGATDKRHLLVLCPNVEAEALSTFVINHNKQTMSVACVSITENLEDIAVLTGATVISADKDLSMETAGMEVLGECTQVIADMDSCLIAGGKGDNVDSYVLSLGEQKDGENNKQIDQRIANLTGGVSVIKVGAFTDTELSIKKNKIEDAIHSSKLAIDNGVVIGGGAAFYHISNEMDDGIFKEALKSPMMVMAKNSGITHFDDIKAGHGINFIENKTQDMFKAGIVDAFSVERTALESAVSIASSVITMDVCIVNEEE